MKTLARQLKILWQAEAGFPVPVTPATAASARAAAQAGSLPYRGLPIRETRESSGSLEPTDASPTASRRDCRLTLSATPQSPGNPHEINRP
jgi:hypothetical protein